jgi:hypothetical protein
VQEGRGVGGREEDFDETEECVERMAGNLKMTKSSQQGRICERGGGEEVRDNAH